MQNDVGKLIPHAGSMCLLDEVLSWDEGRIVCEAGSHLLPDNPLRQAGCLPVTAGIEYASQAMAAHGQLRVSEGAPRRGFIGVIDTVQWTQRRLDVGETRLLIEAVLVEAMPDCSRYQFQLRFRKASIESEPIISGQVMVVLESQ